MQLSTLITAITVALAGSVEAQGYVHTCSGQYLYGGWITGGRPFEPSLKARCRGDRGETCSALALNRCVIWSGGRLRPQSNGNFFNSCSECRLTLSYLDCYCRKSNGQWTWAAIHTNDFITNRNGRLECFGHHGDVDDRPGSCDGS